MPITESEMLIDAPAPIGPTSDPRRYLLLAARPDEDGRRRGAERLYSGHDALTGEAVDIVAEAGDRCEPPDPTPEGWVRVLDRFVAEDPTGDPGGSSGGSMVFTVSEAVHGPTLCDWLGRSERLTFDETEAIVGRLRAALDAAPHGALTADDVVLSSRGFLLRSDVERPAGPEDDSWRRDADRRFLRRLRGSMQRSAVSGAQRRTPRSRHRAQRALVFSIVLGVVAALTGQAGADSGGGTGDGDRSKVEIPATTTEPTGLIGEPGVWHNGN